MLQSMGCTLQASATRQRRCQRSIARLSVLLPPSSMRLQPGNAIIGGLLRFPFPSPLWRMPVTLATVINSGKAYKRRCCSSSVNGRSKQMNSRKLGKSNLDVSPLGLGCWAIGGPTEYHGNHFGWGEINEDEAIRAIHIACDAGITFFDTADIYGTGHSERILGQALAGRRDQVLIATKFGLTFEEYSGKMTGRDASAAYVRRACEASLRRLGTD